MLFKGLGVPKKACTPCWPRPWWGAWSDLSSMTLLILHTMDFTMHVSSVASMAEVGIGSAGGGSSLQLVLATNTSINNSSFQRHSLFFLLYLQVGLGPCSTANNPALAFVSFYQNSTASNGHAKMLCGFLPKAARKSGSGDVVGSDFKGGSAWMWCMVE